MRGRPRGKSKKGELLSWDDLRQQGNELVLWISSRYQGEHWFETLAKRWGTSTRMVRFFVRGERELKAAVLYNISQDTSIPMETLVEQNCLKGP